MFDWFLEVLKQNNAMSHATEAYTDVVELCALLQCLGFSVKSRNTSENRMSEESGARTVIINCPVSGLQVVLESSSSTCSCPPEPSQQNSGTWHVSGVAGGQRLDQEFGYSILGSLPKAHRERLSKELRVIMRCIKENSDIDVEKANQAKERSTGSEKANKSASMETRLNLLKPDTPTHYRSLDTLTSKEDQQFPAPGLLGPKLVLNDTSAEEVNIDDVTSKRKLVCRRQNTYTVSHSGIPLCSEKVNKSASMETRLNLLKPDTPTHYRSLDTLTSKEDQQFPAPGLLGPKLVLNDTSAEEVNIDDVTSKRKLVCRRQNTVYTVSPSGIRVKIRSSPLQQPRATVLDSFIAAEKAASSLQHQLANIIEQFDEGKDVSSMLSLALDVSKISLPEGTEPMKQQFASSPNLSGLGTVSENIKKNTLLRTESNTLVPKVPNKDGVASKLRRLSPNFFKKNPIKDEKVKPQDSKSSKLNSLFKTKAAVTPKFKSESSPNLSGSKKKDSHIKSTIPRATPKKE